MPENDQPIKLSVAICTHNPKLPHLQRTLNALKGQTLPVDSWELLVIDNCSDRAVKGIVSIDWHPRVRWLEEPRLGVIFARLCALSSSNADQVLFVDDDTVLSHDYLERSFRIRADYPCLEVFGSGDISPEFEVTPPEWASNFLCHLGLRTVDFIQISDRYAAGSRPWTAGMSVSRNLARKYLQFSQQESLTTSLGRRGNELLSGEDVLFSLLAEKNGYKFGIFPELRIIHLLPKERLEHAYLKRLVRANAYSRCILSRIAGQSAQNPLTIPSWKAALALMLSGQRKMGLNQLLDFFKFVSKQREEKELLRESFCGWQDGLSFLRSGANR